MEFRINDIDLRSIIVDVIRNCWMIILVMLATYFAIAGGRPPADKVWKIPWNGKVNPKTPYIDGPSKDAIKKR